MMFQIEKPLPRPNEDTQPYWEACRRGELRMQRCRACGHLRFPPSALCPHCLSDQALWEKLSGRGKIFSWIVVHRPQHPAFYDGVPYNVAIVELAEGPRMHTNIVGCNENELYVGMLVEVVFERVNEEITLPKFRPARDTRSTTHDA